jgi:hypothetical protein
VTAQADEAPPGEFPDEASPAGFGGGSPSGDYITDLAHQDPEYGAWQQDFTGLLSLGSLHGSFDWCGHLIAIHTLTTDEELLVGQLIREFEGGMAGMKAYATATAGLCVTAIDHQPMPVPLGEHPNQSYKWALERFNYARRWFPPTIDAILDAYLQLEARQRGIIKMLGKASAPGAAATPGLSASSGSPSAAGS